MFVHILQVNVTQFLRSIDRMDISTGELLSSGYFKVTWFDQMLTWDPSMYGGKYIIPLPKAKFWKPEIAVSHAPAYGDELIYSSDFTAWSTHQGHVTMVHAGNFKTRCSIDTTFYPVDSHECIFQISVLNHDTSELSLSSPTTDINTDKVDQNIEWQIDKTIAKTIYIAEEEIEHEQLIPLLQTTIVLKRRPSAIMMFKYCPFTFLTFLNLFTCFVRPDSGERLSFAVTLYLSLILATTSLMENMPTNSLKIPLMLYDVLLCNFINTAGVFWSIYVVHLAKTPKDQLKMPAFIIRYTSKVIKHNTVSRNYIFEERSDITNEPGTTLEMPDDVDENSKTGNDNAYVPNDVTGLDVAIVLDKVYFVFVLAVVVDVGIIFSAIYVSSR